LYIGKPSLRVPTTVTLSPAVVGVPSVTFATQFESALATLSAGQEMETAPPDWVTVTVKLQSPPPSDEVEVTVVVPTGKNEPDAGDDVTEPQLPPDSVANVTTAPETVSEGSAGFGPVVSEVTVMFAGQVSVHPVGVPVPDTEPVDVADVSPLILFVSVVTETLFPIELPAPTLPTRYWTVKVVRTPTGRLVTVQTTSPALPVPGSVHVMLGGSIGPSTAWKVVNDGVGLVNLAFTAASGPKLTIVISNVTIEPAVTRSPPVLEV